MSKKKLQFLVTEDIFNQFEAIRKTRFSSTAKQTLIAAGILEKGDAANVFKIVRKENN